MVFLFPSQDTDHRGVNSIEWPGDPGLHIPLAKTKDENL